MGTTNIQEAKVLIASTRLADRTRGLKDLSHIIRHNQGRSSLENLGNKAYLALCETIFQCMRDERSAWLRSKPNSKTAATLPLCAQALRNVVTSGVRTIKSSTVEVIIESLLEVLPGRNGTIIKPLLEDLPKVLRALLEYQPHVERLSQGCWDAAVDFCLDTLSTLIAEPDPELQDSWDSTGAASSRGRTPFESADGPPKTSSRDLPVRAKPLSEEFSHATEDFVHCLHSLTKASNSPVLEKADAILTLLIQMLQRKTGRGHATTLATVDAVLGRISLHSTQLTKRVVRELLPLMKAMWSDASMRDELLIFLTQTEAHISSILADQHETSASSALEALVETMYGDYRRRQETATHQYLEEDHLCFRHVGKPDTQSHPLKTVGFSMESKHMQSESLWATVQFIAHYSFLLDERKRTSDQRKNGGESLSKRPRISDYYHDYLRHLSETRTNAKRAALQVIAFMVQEGPVNVDDLQSTVERLVASVADENPVHATWAMTALAAAAFQISSKDPALQSHWMSAWQSASRAVTSVSSSRAACHLMNILLKLGIVPFSSISETVQTMLLSIELSGPALLTESSSSLLATIMQERIAENPTHFNQTAERILSWLLSKWTPSDFPDRGYASLNAHHCCARDALRLIHVCLDKPFVPPPVVSYGVVGPVGQARIQNSLYRNLTLYLLLLDEPAAFQANVISDRASQESTSSERQPPQLKTRIIDHALSELAKTKQRWKEWSHHNPQAITSDMMRVLTNSVIIASALITLGDNDDQRMLTLHSAIDVFTQSFVNFLVRRQTDQDKIDAVIEVCLMSLPDIQHLEVLSPEVFRNVGLLGLAKYLSKALDDRKGVKESFQAEEDDLMDIDEGPNSQHVSGITKHDRDVPRRDVQANTEAAAVRASCIAYIRLISSVADLQDGDDYEIIPSDFVVYLASIHESELLRCRLFLKDLLSTGFRLQRSSCLQLLDRLSDTLIDPRAREYNTSEVANSLMMEVLIGTTLLWSPAATDRDEQDLYENVQALYSYYVKDIEKSGVRRSIILQKSIATFLHSLLKYHPDFGQGRKSQSVRTSLFELLYQGEIPVKDHIGGRLPSIFEDFVLSEHDKILSDVDNNLPADNTWPEGIAVRLNVLGKLAARWHSLLRQSIYRIFATAGSIEDAADHARLCINAVSNARGLENSQELFRLFCPQIIFTWLDRKRKFSEVPFLAFNYQTLVELIRDVESEAVGQAIMLGREDEVAFLAQQLGTTTAQILKRNIGKAGAYTISWDTCKGNARNKSIPSNMMLLRDLVGSDAYIGLIQVHFPKILGYILRTLDQEERIAKPLDKRPAFASTAKALAEMNDISHSTQNISLGIEPSFSAFYLFDQLERLCRRTAGDPVTFWTPSIYTFVLRMLLDRIHPALGSLYARSVIRKVRILVALAGSVAYEGYPLQMTLQSLRPFLTDIQCAEDTLGIMQYLFHHGEQYLKNQLSFVTGIGLSILISIRVFLGSSQESTTQQSQHVATMNKAQRFHAWLTNYLERYAETLASNQSSSYIKAFKQIITAASRVRTEGNSLKGSEESKLLLEILDDDRSNRNLLNSTSREVALDLLCQNFQPAPSARDDIFGTDAHVVGYASQVWESCQRNNLGDGYLLWAARVLGRTFSAHGEVKRRTDQSRPWSGQFLSSKDSLGKVSRAAIVTKIIDLFFSDDRKEVGLAEHVVRLIISRLSDESYAAELAKTIPQHIGIALKLPLPSGAHAVAPAIVSLEQSTTPSEDKPVNLWIKDLAVSLCQVASQDPVIGSLPELLIGIDSIAERLFPYILHLVLLQEFDGDRTVREVMSEACSSWFQTPDPDRVPHLRNLIGAILYLRSQPTPKEVTRVDRDKWLDIDYLKAADAATTCGMYRSALLFAETSSGQPVIKSATRRSSVLVSPPKIPVNLQLSIYKNLEEPDSFYGVDRGSSLESILDRFDYEGDGIKSLLFRGARLDSQMRRANAMTTSDSRGMVKSLITLNMNSIAHSLLSNEQFQDMGDDVVDSTLHTARKLGQWDIKAPEMNHGESSTMFKAFQGLHYAKDAPNAREQLDRQLLATMNYLSGRDRSAISTKSRLRTLAVLTEADEIITSSDPEQLLDVWDQMKSRERWMRAGEFEDVRVILSARETLFSVLSGNPSLLDSIRARTGSIRHMEVEALVTSSTLSRRHGALQDSLASVTYLSDIIQPCKAVGLDIDARAKHEVASVLWDQGEAETSIRMRQHLIEHTQFDSQTIEISLPVLLAKLGHHLAEARLAKPDSIIRDYLEPAIQELKGQTSGIGPGQVFHEFALFCDKQLQSPEAAEDLERLKTVMDKKHQEYQEFMRLASGEKSKSTREVYRRNAIRAKNWYVIDNVEYERFRRSREQFLRQCLENYLLSLQASDEYNNDALRVFTLWLENADTTLANDAVAMYLSRVPSGKFALLMNQLSSRLQAETTEFQKLLSELVFRVCVDHPYHGMHQIFAIQMKVGPITREDAVRSKDESARSRQRAAIQIAQLLSNDKRARSTWSRVHHSDEIYHALAMTKNDQDNKTGRELTLDRYPESVQMKNKIPALKVPPATLQVEVRSDCNYRSLPVIESFKNKMSIANGLSAPKIIVAIGSDGKPYKQLFKSGNDDLRQDAIMEQVFDQVSRLLKNHTATRLRNLGIRTYKVLPLSTRSGLMEFVQNTMPLHQYVMPAHEKYYPSDWKSDRCRKEIANCQADQQSTRVKVWQKMAENFHPVLRYFLLERFEDPDEWFERRLAYTRSTAAISILGHVLGLGDRHCHNILLDEKSGEVVHIDLGVSFEAGRVLPVPEVVPFRLTRDLVDAMGYTKTEGVFRRCCEFTMDTLREERESIMTLLNVLRYDPLVNWSVTPTKAKRMQEGQETNQANGSRAGTVGPGGTPGPPGAPSVVDEGIENSNKKREEQAGEAGRALSVVEKKLSKTLSTRATVNELIQTATDERNLAVLYCGWASYA
ncbi:hypothetical protein BDV96DRAFT_497142 [Lophiotrema nucula]|uniref:Serine/threonine-protein kinase Tel1 n=1 Tax=Lophiotrema nucula TaxID=690887 RepID=A0A6A5Z0N7_9PLEO|nr:hypothetical protein BDV96DRAFT_497142 [Lophiotrema nucula]